MRTVFVLLIALAVTALLGGSAGAGTTILEKDFVGGKENALKTGGGNYGSATLEASRFAGCKNSIAEGAPTGNDENRSGDDITGGENFTASGDLIVGGEQSCMGNAVSTNIPTCGNPGEQFYQAGSPAHYTWKIKLERPVISDIAVQICLDVRRCQNEDDYLGAAQTISVNDQKHGPWWEAPLYLRVRHFHGPLSSGGTTNVEDLKIPGLKLVGGSGLWQDLPMTANPYDFDLEESITLIGRDCITKFIPNSFHDPFAAHDHVEVGIRVPSSTRVRVWAAKDSVALVYLGAVLPGEDL